MKKILRLAVILAVILAAGFSIAADIPYLTGRVTDNAQIISPEIKKSLTSRLKAHEDATTNQIAVLTIPSLGGQSIEEYAVAVFKEWKLGQKGKDNGILLIVAPKDRRMRIEVGYGLEGIMPDSVAGDIIRNVLTPSFKAGDYNGGIDAGVQAIITVLEGGKTPEGESETAKSGSGLNIEGPDLSLTERILFGSFIFGIIGLFTVIGVLTPGMGWFLYFFLIPFWAIFPIVVVGTEGALYLLGTYVIAFPIAKILVGRSDWYNKASKDLSTKGSTTIGGFKLSSSSSSSSWSSGSSSSSSFSGGGGSSGGAGSSGGW